jgi:hypothetical protein
MHCDHNTRTPMWRSPDPQHPGASPPPQPTTTPHAAGSRVAAATPRSRSFVLAALRALHLDGGAPPPAPTSTTRRSDTSTRPHTTNASVVDKPFHTNARSGVLRRAVARAERCSYVLSRVGSAVAGRPVMGHSCEGRLLSSHALPGEMVAVTGRQIVRRTTGWCQAVIGPDPSPRSRFSRVGGAGRSRERRSA